MGIGDNLPAAKIQSHKDLLIWQQSMDLAVGVYAATRFWPREEIYGLTSQARRSAPSIPANIAEGYGRETRASYLNFLRISQGSLKELETHLLIAQRAGIASDQQLTPLFDAIESVGKLLRLLLRRLEKE